MKDIVIASAVRTPIGAFGKSLKDVSAVELGALVVRTAVERAGLPASAVDEVIMGNVLSAGLGQNAARQMAIGAGIPRDVPSFTVGKVCGSGLRSVSLAVQILKAGDASCIVAGGAENMSQAPHLLAGNRWGTRLGHGTVLDSLLRDGLHDAFDGYPMGETAENIADRWDISRTEQDAYALESQRRAERAIAEGAFREEVVPVPLIGGRGMADSFSVDEHPRKVSAEKLAGLEPIFRSGGTVTAGNSSGINDGAAALVLMSRDAAEQAEVPILATVRGYASAGVDPDIMGYGPVPATRKAMAASGWMMDDLDMVELNEAFASQSLAVMRDLGLDSAIVNVHGGAIALGHPIGCSGARILTTLVHAMDRRNARKGVATLCIGGGMGIAMCIERETGTSRNP